VSYWHAGDATYKPGPWFFGVQNSVGAAEPSYEGVHWLDWELLDLSTAPGKVLAT
jgi:hypothetical protein